MYKTETEMDQAEENTMARSEVDTTRPFQSVKEAVAVFGDRILFNNSGSFNTPNPNSSSFGTKRNPNFDASQKPEPIQPLQGLNSSLIEADTNPNIDASSEPIVNMNPNLDASPKSISPRSQQSSNSSPKYKAIPSPQNSFFSSPINKPLYSARSSPQSYATSISNPDEQQENETENTVFDYLKRLELEVAETKKEITTLKKREYEMEMALATLNAQLNMNLSKLAEIEAMRQEDMNEIIEEKLPTKVRSNRWEEETENSMMHYEYLPSLSQALSLRGLDDEFGFELRGKVQKKIKPIVPLVGDIFKKKSSKYNNSFYSPSIYSMLS